ncbi:cohesin domain-containing protein [Candidatus Microgenomates bacterium]|nr:cohesin domain-containing protein [Candidatus Microgenomates bacterium]
MKFYRNIRKGIIDYWGKVQKDLRKTGRKQKIIILAVLGGCLVIGLLLPFIYRTFLSAKSGIKTNLKPVKLSLTPTKQTVKSGETFMTNIFLSSPDNGVEAADFVVKFDPNVLKATNIATGNFFREYPIKETYTDSVKVSGIATLVEDTFLIPKGEGIVATITFQTLKPAVKTVVSFDREKTIIASDGKNVLEKKNISDLQITVK